MLNKKRPGDVSIYSSVSQANLRGRTKNFETVFRSGPYTVNQVQPNKENIFRSDPPKSPVVNQVQANKGKGVSR